MDKLIGLSSLWDMRFVELARFVSNWSKDPKAKVGAVVVNGDGVISLGYNGFPVGIEDDERLKDQEIKREMIIHAEENALFMAGNRAKEATLYVFGKPVCAVCARVIIQARISRIVSMNPKDEEPTSMWYASGISAARLFKEAGIKIKYYKV